MRLIELSAGHDPGLNAREYQLRRLYERVLQALIDQVDLDADTAEEALKNLEQYINIYLTPAQIALITKNIEGTVGLGFKDANIILRRAPASMRIKITVAVPEPSLHPALVSNLAGHSVMSLNKMSADVKYRLAQTLREGYQAGEPIPTLAGRIRLVTNTSKVSSTRLARTLTNETYNQAHMVRYKNAGIDGVQFSAAHNEKTCDICAALDSTIWPINDPGIVRPPVHENCRCRLLPWYKKLPGPRHIDSEVMDFYREFRENRFPVPLYA